MRSCVTLGKRRSTSDLVIGMVGVICKDYQEKFNTEIWSCCWIRDGNGQDILIYSGLDEEIKLATLKNNSVDVYNSIEVPQSQSIPHIRPHKTEPWIVSTTIIGQINVFDVTTRDIKYSTLSPSCINWPSFFSSPTTICAPSKTSGVAILDIEKDVELINFVTMSPYISCGCINDQGDNLACCNFDSVVEVFDVNNGKLIYVMEGIFSGHWPRTAY
ncbi:hypothetical protein RF11_08787 [Thelohanellus kitauei]|uniref:Uncharacterized protein n=1 Tax=Thelohanellus kitauei TaxID=669202 RepID=A0A0C2MVB2_THEKT|nr:hypothetical protein RF11_08787 [Thelohanellus kitauei]